MSLLRRNGGHNEWSCGFGIETEFVISVLDCLSAVFCVFVYSLPLRKRHRRPYGLARYSHGDLFIFGQIVTKTDRSLL